MGFLNSCWEAFLQITTYAHSLGISDSQLPLHLPNHDPNDLVVAPSNHVSFQVPGRQPGSTFTCEYTMPSRYVPCNNATDRGCWLKSTTPGQRDYDINTDCMYLQSVRACSANAKSDETWSPVGITREVRTRCYTSFRS